MRYDYEIWTQYVFDEYVIACQRILLKISFWQSYGNTTDEILTIFLEGRIFDGPSLGQFLSDFQKLGTVIIGEARSFIWVPIFMISKISLKNNLEFTFILNKACVHPLKMLRFSRNRTGMLLCWWWSIFSSAPLDSTRKGADDAP